jgi:hypothetical protein
VTLGLIALVLKTIDEKLLLAVSDSLSCVLNRQLIGAYTLVVETSLGLPIRVGSIVNNPSSSANKFLRRFFTVSIFFLASVKLSWMYLLASSENLIYSLVEYFLAGIALPLPMAFPVAQTSGLFEFSSPTMSKMVELEFFRIFGSELHEFVFELAAWAFSIFLDCDLQAFAVVYEILTTDFGLLEIDS